MLFLGGGMYGYLQNLTRIAEAQRSQKLHAHMLIKRYNFANPNVPLPFFSQFENYYRLHGHTPLPAQLPADIPPSTSKPFQDGTSANSDETMALDHPPAHLQTGQTAAPVLVIHAQPFPVNTFTSFIDTCKSYGPPDSMKVTCPRCKVASNLVPVKKIPITAYMKLRKNSAAFLKGPPILVNCSTCSLGFGSTDLLLHLLCENLEQLKIIANQAIGDLNAKRPFDLFIPQLDFAPCTSLVDADVLLQPLTAVAFEQYIHHPIGNLVMDERWPSPVRAAASDILILYRALIFNGHLVNHTFTCFKKGNICRSCIPRTFVPHTYIDKKSGDIKIKHPLGTEYINAYNWVVLLAMPTNHDFRDLMRIRLHEDETGSIIMNLSVNACYYTIVYLFDKKNSEETSTMQKVTLERRRQREQAAAAANPEAPQKTVQQQALGLTMSLVHSSVKSAETDVTIASLVALGFNTINFSLGLQTNFMLSQFLSFVENTSTTVLLSSFSTASSQTFLPMDQISAYTQKPADLITLSPYAMLTLFEIARGRFSRAKWFSRRDADGNDSAYNKVAITAEDLATDDPYGIHKRGPSVSPCGFPFNAAYPFKVPPSSSPYLAHHFLKRFQKPNCCRIIGPAPPDTTQFLDIDGHVTDPILADIYATSMLLTFKAYTSFPEMPFPTLFDPMAAAAIPDQRASDAAPMLTADSEEHILVFSADTSTRLQFFFKLPYSYKILMCTTPQF